MVEKVINVYPGSGIAKFDMEIDPPIIDGQITIISAEVRANIGQKALRITPTGYRNLRPEHQLTSLRIDILNPKQVEAASKAFKEIIERIRRDHRLKNVLGIANSDSKTIPQEHY